MTEEKATPRLGHAIVIGRSMAGLMAARALADHFEKVTLLDRDKNPSRPSPRKGVPQGKHIHVLLDSGKDVIEEYYPGLLGSIDGIHVINTARDFIWRHLGVWKSRYASSISMVLATRPFLEWHVRKALLKKKNVRIRSRTSVEEYLTDESKQRILGVVIKDFWGRNRPLQADLVVDASGRGSRTPRWLEQNGYSKPDREEFGIDITYTSRLFKPGKNFRNNWDALLIYPLPPDQKRSGLVSRVEKGRFIVTLNGYFKEEAPADPEGFLEYAGGLASPEIYDFLKDARPASGFSVHRVPSAYRNFYERLARFPEGLVVLGDAVCALNPVFGQGMTTAALAARELGREVAASVANRPEPLSNLGRRFFARLPGVYDAPWFLTTTEDCRYEETTGPRRFGLGFLNWYKARLIELTSVDDRINEELWKVVHLKSGIGNVLKPSVALPVLVHGIKSFFVPIEKRARTTGIPEP